MKKLLTLALISLCFIIVSGFFCNSIDCKIQKAKDFIAQKDYKKAVKNLDSANIMLGKIIAQKNIGKDSIKLEKYRKNNLQLSQAYFECNELTSAYMTFLESFRFLEFDPENRVYAIKLYLARCSSYCSDEMSLGYIIDSMITEIDGETSLQVLNNLIIKCPGQKDYLLFMQGKQYVRLNKIEEAKNYFKKISKKSKWSKDAKQALTSLDPANIAVAIVESQYYYSCNDYFFAKTGKSMPYMYECAWGAKKIGANLYRVTLYAKLRNNSFSDSLFSWTVNISTKNAAGDSDFKLAKKTGRLK